ncbi:response regulator [Streptomyces sp. NPDC001941]|uniref:response regulator n=1 Tax=Streptomyces sp. NPDC001941 TaxID=3154659 RepID=UPI00332FBF1B
MDDGEMKILVVDDQEDNLFALESTLRPIGRPVARARSGAEALKTVMRGGIAVILLDVLMPQMDGLEVLSYLKRLEQTKDVPVILVTGLGRDDGMARRAFGLGVADILVKPVDPWTLRARVRTLADLYAENVALRRQLDTLREHPSDPGRVPEQREERADRTGPQERV